jgi:DNA-binding Xre family transcriptional regulator
MTLEQVVAALQTANLSYLSRVTGLHYNTIRRIKTGENTNPTTHTLLTLSKHIRRNAHDT